MPPNKPLTPQLIAPLLIEFEIAAVIALGENDAAAMAKDVAATGHVTLYGIYFDTDKADLKPESAPTLLPLKPAGAGPIAPVAPNDTEDGRAKNRRVELVKQ